MTDTREAEEGMKGGRKGDAGLGVERGYRQEGRE